MNITLTRLSFKNFKGIGSLTVDFSPVTGVYGDNGTGKTTLFDGFTYVFFDKDSQNKKDFDIKPLDANNNVIHGVSPEVEAALLVDGKPVTLRKVYSENWTKKRGSATREFTGHTTDYFIDGVPVKQKEYKDRIDALIQEDLFKLLTSPTYFNEQMDWKKRRAILLQVCGDVSDAEVIASNESLENLPSILGSRSIDDHRKVIAARRTEINNELEKIPVRIDEAERSKPDTSGLDEAELQHQIEQLKTDVELKESQLVRLQSGGEVSVQEKRQREIEGELLDIKNRVQSGALDAVGQQQKKVATISSEVYGLQHDIRHTQLSVSESEDHAKEARQKATQLRDKWNAVNAETFEPHVADSCPTCNQSLPAEQVQAAHDKALSDFNRGKSERLEQITRDGRAAMELAAKMDEAANSLRNNIVTMTDQLSAKEHELSIAKEELQRLQSGIQDVSTNPDYIAKQQELETVKASLLNLRSSVQADVERVRLKLIDLRDELRRKETALANFTQVRNLDARIDELKKQERQLAAEYEQLEQELYLTEEFIRCKVSLLEERINSKFKYARFKLFETQINGGVAETCQTLYNGVPYGSGLNNAARINVGLDIINTLSEHHGLTAPIFIDNRESVTRLVGTNAQVISLIVSERDKQLRVETDNNNVKEAV